MVEETRKMIHKYSEKPVYTRKDTGEVTCTACGKAIQETYAGDVHYSKTKRGSVLFWHTACTEAVNNTKMKWRKV